MISQEWQDRITHIETEFNWLINVVNVLDVNNDALVKLGREQNRKIDEAIKLHLDLGPLFRNEYWDKFKEL